MSCVEYQELISAYLDDELTKEELKTLLVHLDACQTCKKDLTTFIFQKEKLVTLRAIPSGPKPDQNFAQMVLEKIPGVKSNLITKKFPFSFSQLINRLVCPMKKPLFAGALSFLILVGVLTGVFLERFKTHQETKKLLSVYELQDKKIPQGTTRFASVEDEKKAIVFHHVASTSCETLTNEPSLLRYTAYTTSNGNNHETR